MAKKAIKKTTTIEDLAKVVKTGFSEANKRTDALENAMKVGFSESKKRTDILESVMKIGFEKVEKRFEKIDERFEKVDEGFEKADERIDDLAGMVQRGFLDAKNEIDIRFEQSEKKIVEQVDQKIEMEISEVNSQLHSIRGDIAEIKRHFVYKFEFEDLMGRVKYLETKMGIESGK